MIQSNNINIHPSVKFGKNVNIKCDSIELGEFCIIGDNVTIECNSFGFDSWLFIMVLRSVEVDVTVHTQMLKLVKVLVYLKTLY